MAAWRRRGKKKKKKKKKEKKEREEQNSGKPFRNLCGSQTFSTSSPSSASDWLEFGLHGITGLCAVLYDGPPSQSHG